MYFNSKPRHPIAMLTGVEFSYFSVMSFAFISLLTARPLCSLVLGGRIIEQNLFLNPDMRICLQVQASSSMPLGSLSSLQCERLFGFEILNDNMNLPFGLSTTEEWIGGREYLLRVRKHYCKFLWSFLIPPASL